MKNTIHILKINEVKGHKVFCVFSNGEYRYVDIKKILTDRNIGENDILSNLYREEEMKGVVLNKRLVIVD